MFEELGHRPLPLSLSHRHLPLSRCHLEFGRSTLTPGSQWQDPDPHTAVYVGVMTGWGGEGRWEMCFDSGIGDEPDETYIGCFEDSADRDIEVNTRTRPASQPHTL